MRRKHLFYAIGAFALLGYLLWRAIGAGHAVDERPAPPAPVAATPPAEAPSLDLPDSDSESQPPMLPDADEEGDEASAFASIDLDAVRKALPDNSYWDNAAPTTDPRLLGDRERAEVHWNEQYGKLLSGTGTEAEIKEYFDHRMRLSSDYVRFADYVIETQGSKLSDQDLELLHVAKRLQLARLGEIPRRMQEAFDRKREQDEARAAWLAEQREFEEGGGEPADSPDSKTPTEDGVP